MVKPTDTSGHSAAAAAQGATAGAGAADAAPKARASDSSLHAQIASGTKSLLGRDVSRMDLTPVFEQGLLTRTDVLRAYFTNATPETQAKIKAVLTSGVSAESTTPQGITETIAMKMIPDDFMIAYLIETVAPEKLEKALTDAGIDMPAQYAAIGELVTKCAPEGIKFPDDMTAEDGKEHFFNSYHGDTPLKQFLSIIETCGDLPADVLAKSTETDHGLPIQFVTQKFVDLTMEAKSQLLKKQAKITHRIVGLGGQIEQIDLPLLPKILFQLDLTELTIYNTNLYCIPREIGQSKALPIISIARTPIKEIPQELFSDRLLFLSLFNNQGLRELPSTIEKATQLIILSLTSNTNLTTLPTESMRALTNLAAERGLEIDQQLAEFVPDNLEGAMRVVAPPGATTRAGGADVTNSTPWFRSAYADWLV